MPDNWGAFWEDAFVWIVLLTYVSVALAAYRGFFLLKAGKKLAGWLLLAFAAIAILVHVSARIEQK